MLVNLCKSLRDLKLDHVDSWPTTGHRALYESLTPGELNSTSIRKRLEALVDQTFRRMPPDGEPESSSNSSPASSNKAWNRCIPSIPVVRYTQFSQVPVLNLGEGELNEAAFVFRLSYLLLIQLSLRAAPTTVEARYPS